MAPAVQAGRAPTEQAVAKQAVAELMAAVQAAQEVATDAAELDHNISARLRVPDSRARRDHARILELQTCLQLLHFGHHLLDLTLHGGQRLCLRLCLRRCLGLCR